MKWEYFKTGIDGNCELFGVNIFDYEWESMSERIRVKDPAYGQWHTASVYKVKIQENIINVI